METHQKYISHQPTPLTSSDLPTPRTPSPSLVIEPDLSSRRSSITRRRSWGNNKLREAAKAESSAVHPLHLDFDANMSTRRAIGGGSDPFLSNHELSIPQYTDDLYSDPHEGTSRASLMLGHFKHEMEDDHREDDEAHLTSNMSRIGTDTLLLEDDTANTSPQTPDYNLDPEIEGGSTPRTRRRTVRYSVSPLKKTETAIKSVSKNIKKMSLRVVNLANTELEGHLRLGDRNGDEGKRRASEDEEDDGPPTPDLKKVFPIRGRALGFLGPESRIRLALFNFLVHPWTEPMILILIVVNAVVLTIQAYQSLMIPQSANPAIPPPISGYFHTWEDITLFVLFIIFTLEAFARMCVNGFLFDPQVNIFGSSSLPLQSEPYAITPGASHPAGPTGTGMTEMARQTSLHRSITQKFRRFQNSVLRPFALATPLAHSTDSGGRRDGYPYEATPVDGGFATSDNGYLNSNFNTSSMTFANFNGQTQSHYTQTHHRDTSIASQLAHRAHATNRQPSEPSYLSRVMRSDVPVAGGNPNHPKGDTLALPFRYSISHLHSKTQRNVPYLRQSWTRIDFLAIVSFWITFALATTGFEHGIGGLHIGVFRAISVIRIARLLSVTSGTTTIMHSLKTARPLLANVAYFVVFAMVLFSIIGIQTFKGSLRRRCFISPTNGETSPIQNPNQFCGGYIDRDTLETLGYLKMDGNRVVESKGYVCPLGQICTESANPFSDLESFDAIYYAVLQVIIVAGANGWSPLMYSMIDAEYFVSCLFFISAIVVLNFWLINLFVAVITNTFAAIRSETQKSAFGAAPLVQIEKDGQDDGWPDDQGRSKAPPRPNIVKTIYSYTSWIWVILALTSLVLQATRTVTISPTHALVLYFGELGITLAFDIEIVLRVWASLPEWRGFFEHGNNWIDGVLAIGCTIIQIPLIINSSVYPWFTIFQLARFYRVILVVPRMKPLLLSVFGNMYGLVNMALFLIIVNYIAALVAVQLLRGDFIAGATSPVNFGEVWNAFLAMYQVFSSENWPTILYDAATTEKPFGQAVVALIFISAWFLFANFIVLQMFIAVINENFEVAEEQKKGKQTTNFYSQQKARHGTVSWLRRWNPYRWIKARPVTVKVDNLPSNLVLPMQKVLVQDKSTRLDGGRNATGKKVIGKPRFMKTHYSSKSFTALQQLFSGEDKSEDIPMTTLRQETAATSSTLDPLDEEMERHLELLATVNPGVGVGDDEYRESRAKKEDFIRDFPTYDKVFWVIGQKNKLRQLCQRLVRPARGERIFGKPYSPVAHPIFQLMVLLTVLGGIVAEWIAIPYYRRNYFIEHGRTRGAWFEIAEAVFGFALFIEFLIKIIADGFLLTPNAYLKSIWNGLDFIVMVGVIVNAATSLIFIGGLSRFTRSLKALRVLRLITLIDKMRNTFENLLISGAIRILDAFVLALLYMIPYAVWGLNIFNGKVERCNDTAVQGISDCINEFPNNIYGTSFGYLTPHVWTHPSPSTTFSFDNFRSSLLILFEIVSLEGWIDVMNVATSIVGPGLQSQTNVAQANAIFFVIYNLMGGVVILTLFVSIIIGNFRSKTGMALLTKAQRQWIDLKKLFDRQKPSKRPLIHPTSPIRKWCYDRAVHKRGWWMRTMTLFFFLHILVLMTQTFPASTLTDSLRNDFFLVFMFIYLLDVSVRFFGLGWRSFRSNGWNLFDLVVATGSFITTFAVRFGNSGLAIAQLQRLFLVSIAFKLVQRTDSLNMLFKTAVASLPTIMSLLGLWLVLFLFFAILFVEVFGLTKWGGIETRTQNYYSMGAALVMLAFQTTGEGWNQYMHDFDLTYPRCTKGSETDCGSTGWAFSLFIAWNLLSMYIFANMFTGVVVENFSYVFQASGSGAKSISREQMRSFKKVWAQFSNPKTRYLERPQFAAFFSKLSGVFEVRIHPVEYNISNIVEICKQPPGEEDWTPRVVEGLDLNKLERILDGIDYAEVRKRKAVYIRLYHEAIISHEHGRGISFTNMLTLLAHHKLIVDAEALVLDDLLARNEFNKLVTDFVDLDRVRSLLRTITYRRQFLAHLEKKKAEKYEKDIPSIVVENMPGTPPMSSRDIASAGLESSPTRIDSRYRDLDNGRSVSVDLTLGSRLQRSHARRPSDYSTISMDVSKSPRTSWMEDELEDDVNTMGASVWGDLMKEVAEEEESRRTF